MSIKELRIQTGLSQSKFAHMFDIPVSTLKDWEHERRNPPAYVIRTILEMRGVIINDNSINFCEIRRKRVERAMAIVLTATDGPDEIFMEALESYIAGEMTLEELEVRVDRLEYLGV